MRKDAAMTPDNRTRQARLASLDYRIEAEGIDADPVSLLLLAHTARDLGLSELLVSIMVSGDEPDVARVRAYGRVSAQVATTAARELQPAC